MQPVGSVRSALTQVELSTLVEGLLTQVDPSMGSSIHLGMKALRTLVLASRIKPRILMTTHMPFDPYLNEEAVAEVRQHWKGPFEALRQANP